MTEHTGAHQREATSALEERVHLLEDRVAALTEALRVLARGLEDLPAAEPGGRPAAEAARKAHEVLLAVQPS
jgi:hypothetical protein